MGCSIQVLSHSISGSLPLFSHSVTFFSIHRGPIPRAGRLGSRVSFYTLRFKPSSRLMLGSSKASLPAMLTFHLEVFRQAIEPMIQ